MNIKAISIAALCLSLWSCADGPSSENIYSDVTLYQAAQILTQDKTNPSADAVAVKDGTILDVGSFNDLSKTYDGAVIYLRFEKDTITPGLIDPHVHMILGAMIYGLDFVPPWDMETPKGTVKGLPTKTALLSKISEFEKAAPDGPLFLYGYHNLVQGDLIRQDLDTISSTRPIFIWHYSAHDFYLNSAAIKLLNLTPDLAEKYHGVGLDAEGNLNGRIYEDATLVILPLLAPYLLSPQHIGKGFAGYESILARSGVTTVAEMGYGLFGRSLEDGYLNAFYTEDDNYRLYLVPEHRAFTKEFGEKTLSTIAEMSADTERNPPVLPQIKLFTDAAFYSQTMKLASPGYVGGQSKGTDGLWVTEPQDLAGVMVPYWDAGIDIHIHSNGDAAQTSTLNAFSEMKPGQAGQRLIIEHAGLLTPEHIAKAAKLGVGISAASHYVNYMGDDYKEAIGEKVEFITPLASAARAGMPVTIHSDAPLAPPQPMKAASVHMTRITRHGTVSTPSEKLTPEEALLAITLDAAWSLGLDDEIGSIVIGKKADFTIFAANPLDTRPEAWPDIEIKGTMIDGVFKPIP